MKFAHINKMSTNWKNLIDFDVKTLNFKIDPPNKKNNVDYGLKKELV